MSQVGILVNTEKQNLYALIQTMDENYSSVRKNIQC